MYPPIAPELKGRILALGSLNWSSRVILSELKKENLKVCQKTISNVLKNHNNGTRLYVVEPKAKVNAAYFIEKILSPMMLVDVPKLYGRDAKKVILHMDSARSHTAKPVYDWLDSHGIKYFTKEQWLANSPEVSPMEFFANGYFKSQLAKR
ncbi:hypothetical protein BV898_19282 [Hypsibius exemplaris]|uniref:Tc1-like transposase DDE domain-containing protein n=1 Tax=Hypsibius exemplaris TaxID=2072580 RepID=A0A9X6RPG4_HYPEX|nr:hypothetical protein BV898_19282 [Hypsibius exemplaris]